MGDFTPDQIDALKELNNRRASLSADQSAALDELNKRAGIGVPRAGASGGWGAEDGAPEERSIGGFVSNIPKSAGNIVGAIGHVVAHPIDTAQALGQTAEGFVQKATTAMGATDPTKRGLEDYRGKADEVVKSLNERYGGWENIKKTAYEDPVGFLLDASSLLTGGATGAERLGFTTAAKALKTAGELVDPIRAAGKVLAPVAKFGGEAAANIIGKTTGVGADAVKEAAKGGAAFVDQMRDPSHEQIANDVVKAAENVADQRRATYQQQLAQLPSVNLPVAPVEGALKAALAKFKIGIAYKTTKAGAQQVLDFSNSPITDAASQAKIAETFDDVMKRSPSRQLSAADMDTLKQRLSNRISDGVATRGDAVVTAVMDRAKTLLEKQVPGYVEMTKDYAEASDFLRQVRAELSTNASTGTQVRKIHTALNQRNGYRAGLIDELGAKAGKDLRGSIAGAEMSSWAPRGIVAPFIAGGALTHVANVAAHPVAFAAALASASPRFVGELLAALAKARRSGAGAVTDPRVVRAVSAAGSAGSGDQLSDQQ